VLSIVPCVVLAFYALRAVRKQVPFFSPLAVAALFLLYALLPSGYGGWFYINARVIPFVWAALLVRVPESVPRALRLVLALATFAHSGALGIDFVRLTRDREEIAKGIPHVPERANLLPLVFNRKGSSINTRNMVQAWGPYVTERDASVPMLFATLPSYAVRYREPPPPQLTQVALEDWTIDMKSADHFCGSLRTEGVLSGDCAQTFRERWADFFALVGPRFDHLLFWGASADVRALVPSAYRIVFERAELVIYERTP